MPEATSPQEAPGHEHDEHLAHHFDTREQQFEAGKFGMWLFLATEVLLFGGLLCGYAVYRANHPEIFVYAHRFLDSTLGGINTIVLIASSFTMAYAVRAAQLGDQKKLKLCLALTLVGALGFMGIKAIEYEHKWKHGLLWGEHYQSQEAHGESPAAEQTEAAEVAGAEGDAPEETNPEADPSSEAAPAAEAEASPDPEAGQAPEPEFKDRTRIPDPARGPTGLRSPAVEAEQHASDEPRNVQIFFGIYFVMTGLHGLHVLAGMILIAWLLKRAIRGDFGPSYYTPVDLGGLYWHIVDVIWIFLFPLLYLIH